MNFFFFNKLNLKFPLKLFNNKCFFLRNKYIIIKYVYFDTSFIKSVKYINNTYYTMLQLSSRIRKKTILTKNNLSYSTRKLYPQKGLGKARSGSKKSLLKRGGNTIFGPIARTLNIMLNTKRKKISFLYLLLNKRTYVSFIVVLPTIHNFSNINEYLTQEKRINGFFSSKLIYVLFYKLKYIIKKSYPLVFINSLNFNYFLKFDYIIFLI